MAASSYATALARLLEHEGGYSNHPADPGGPTNFGITLGDYRRYVKPDATADDVRAMRIAQAKAIYRARYWDALRCDELPAGLDYALFDYGVNSGVARAARVLQRVLELPDDGRITAAVLAAVRKRDAAALVAAICDERLRFLRSLRTWPVFGNGWARRVAEVKAAALQLARAEQPAASSAPVQGKGAVPAATSMQRGTTAVIAATGASAIHEAHQAGAGWPLVLVIVAITVAAAIAAWFAWRRHQQQRQQAPA